MFWAKGVCDIRCVVIRNAMLLLDTDKSAEEEMMQRENRANDVSAMVEKASAGGKKMRAVGCIRGWL